MSDNKASIQKQFGDSAANYATSAVHVSGADLDAMLQAEPLNDTMHILDAGCGAGHTALAFAPHVKSVIAYDLTPAMLTQVERLAVGRGITNITTQAGDVESLPYENASFDLVVSRYSAHHWPHPQTALGELKRVLKPGGAFILSDIVAKADLTADTYLQAVEVLRDPSHVRDHTIDQWRRMFHAAQFTADVLLAFDIQLGFYNWCRRMNTPHAVVDAIKFLLNAAPSDVRAAFNLPAEWRTAEEFTFTLPGAVIVGRPTG